ncbi:MAG: excinuclease ABC subunit UvrA [Acholeplasmatales bacterium]|jgi:excinuclease ABC subunit A|nr:excinuclease ABC subunit UvrA [Acholeplasmatales bacterium]
MDNTKDFIYIKGAKENNLKNIDVTLPKNSLIVMTGVSGSGKTSLAFDTLYQEGQRRYIESLSSYARQFLGSFEKPAVESIEGLSPSISIDQKTTSQNPRSTVGTVTEIYDYFRLLYARIGQPYDPITNLALEKQTIQDMVDYTLKLPLETKVIILAPLVIREKGTHKKTIDLLIKEGYNRILVDKEYYLLEEVPELDKNQYHDLSVVIDRVVIKEDIRSRIYESFETATKLTKGLAAISVADEVRIFSENYKVSDPNFSIPELEPRLFSFNTPIGACPYCNGLGLKKVISEDLVLDLRKSVRQGGIIPYRNFFEENLWNQEVEQIALIKGIDLNVPTGKMKKEDLNVILYGAQNVHYKIKSTSNRVYEKNAYEGVITNLSRRYLETTSEWIRMWIEQYMSESVCKECGGQRLNKAALSVKIGGKNISELTSLAILKILDFINNLQLNKEQQHICEAILNEINARLKFLVNVGLDYLTLARSSATLSGGEAQRIRLATQIGSKLTGVLYVLDEPSIGLHQKDNDKLIKTLKDMRDLGNTLVVVEHDLETMYNADYIVDIGPKAGSQGGYLVACGTVKDIINSPESITGKYLSGEKVIPYPKIRRVANNKLIIAGARQNNLKNLSVEIPLGVFVAVTGVSGSGKSTLVNEILFKSLNAKLYTTKETPGLHDGIINSELIDKLVEISQTPIGRSPRSNPVTYTGVFDDIREIFTQTQEARSRGYLKGRFSFNVSGGRCEYCSGDGVKRISMHFLPDVYVTCEKCGGSRFNHETLEVKFKGKNIAEVLDMTVSEALEFFKNIPKIYEKIKTLHDCGLDYLKLGQSSTTLSGGEAQRVKLASELYKKPTPKTLYILDEPTTGLHSYDVEKLMEVFNRIVDNGATIVVIEHNLDIIKNADYIIDLGPNGGDEGGYLIACGTPEEVVKVPESFTGQYLKKVLV